MEYELQIIDGHFYTKPPEPVEIPREDVVALLVTAEEKKVQAEANLAQATASRESTIAAQDATIVKHENDVAEADERITEIQALLDQVPE